MEEDWGPGQVGIIQGRRECDDDSNQGAGSGQLSWTGIIAKVCVHRQGNHSTPSREITGNQGGAPGSIKLIIAPGLSAGSRLASIGQPSDLDASTTSMDTNALI